MPKLAELEERFVALSDVEGPLSETQGDHPLFREYEQRLAAAGSSINQARSVVESRGIDPDIAMPALMAGAFNLDRCDAIREWFEGGDRGPARQRTGGDTGDVVRLGKDRVVVRWLVSRTSWLKSRLLRHEAHYAVPPLFQTLKVALAGRVLASARLRRLISVLRRAR